MPLWCGRAGRKCIGVGSIFLSTVYCKVTKGTSVIGYRNVWIISLEYRVEICQIDAADVLKGCCDVDSFTWIDAAIVVTACIVYGFRETCNVRVSSRIVECYVVGEDLRRLNGASTTIRKPVQAYLDTRDIS